MNKGQQTRRKIVQEAAPVFNRHGFAGASLSELMAATGLKKGGIYRHFASKEELAAEAFDYAWDAARRDRQPDQNPAEDPIGWLKAMVENFVTRRSPVAGGCPLLNTAIEADDGNPLLRARALSALKNWTGRLEAVAREGMAQGKIRTDVDPAAVATILVATLEGALMMSRLERSDAPLLRARTHLDSYLEGVGTGGGLSPYR